MTATPINADVPEWRAAGTDLSERRRSGVSCGPIADIPPTPEMLAIKWDRGGVVRLGALVTIDTISRDARIAADYPGISATAGGLATPQIRHLATLGGNLAQRSRCWYFRNPEITCFKKGGSTCPARTGNHLFGTMFDTGPCVAPHPSSMAVALMAYDAVITTDRRKGLKVEDFFGDGSNGGSDNALQPGEMIIAIDLPPAVPNERAVYKRAISRTHAEWPLVEAVARVVIKNGVFEFVRLAAGGVAPVPVRLADAEGVAKGAAASGKTIAQVARAATAKANPLPMTGYKVTLLEGLLVDVLEQCLDS